MDFKSSTCFESLATLAAYIYGIFPVWFIICSFINLLCLKDFSHWLHWYGFSPVCILMWVVRLPTCVNAISHVALIWSFPSMNPEVSFKKNITYKSLITLATLISTLPSVYIYMSFKSIMHWKCLITLSTLIWSFLSMCYYVSFKMANCCKCLVTFTTLKSFFTIMNPNVFF